jgi:hypothetical protein
MLRTCQTEGKLTLSFDLRELAKQIGDQSYPPVDEWDPEFCGDMDMRIARDGTWFYMGSPIGRRRLVKLFSSVLRRDRDGQHYLVTPVEKLGIIVDDAPLLVVEMTRHGAGQEQAIEFRTLTDDRFLLDEDHPLRVETNPENGEPAPYVKVRGNLEALVSRPVFYELVDLADRIDAGKIYELVVRSCGQDYSLGEVNEDA